MRNTLIGAFIGLAIGGILCLVRWYDGKGLDFMPLLGALVSGAATGYLANRRVKTPGL